MTNRQPEPLKWSFNWQNLGQWDKFLMWVPLIGPQRRIHADLLRQLKMRSAHDFQAWEKLGPEISRAARSTNEILITHLGWPKSAVFLPDDPGDIPFWDETGDISNIEAIMAVEEHFAVTLSGDFWVNLSKLTYGEVIARLIVSDNGLHADQ